MKNFWIMFLIISAAAIYLLPIEILKDSQSMKNAGTLAALGFTVLGGYLTGRWLIHLGIPQVTGYMLTGVLLGPYVIGMFTVEMVDNLGLINHIALVLIALTAGGELKLRELKGRVHSILSVLLSQTIVVLLVVGLTVLLTGSLFLNFTGTTLIHRLAIALLFGVIMTANSPSVAVAVVTELRAKGQLTDTVLSVTVLKDLVVIILFTLSMTLARSVMGGSAASSHDLQLPFMIAGSIFLGLVSGIVMVIYMKYINRHNEIAVIVLATILIKLVSLAPVELLLTAVTIGIVIENVSSQGQKLIDSLERISPPVYVVFIALAGASINLTALVNIILIAVALMIVRGTGIWLGTGAGLRIAKSSFKGQKFLWMGYLPQAGVSLGMAGLIATEFPGWGVDMSTLILGVVAINQLLGPVGFRLALIKAGEVNGEKANA